MKFCHNAVAIIISALIFPTKAGFSLVGTGLCLDSEYNAYDYVYLEKQTNDINAAINWCKTATAYVSFLVGVEIGYGLWYCSYDDGIIDNIQNTDFSPTASSKGNGLFGIGAVNSSDGRYGYTCYENEVRRIDSSCIIYFLSSLTALPNSLIFRILE
jgi:hypothetical protein